MSYYLYIIFIILFSLWLLFFNGAERIEDTWLAKLEFGESIAWIKFSAWFSLIGSSVFLIYSLFS